MKPTTPRRRLSLCLLLVLVSANLLSARGGSFRYAIVLNEPAVVETGEYGKGIRSAAALDRQRQIRTSQRPIESEVRRRGLSIHGASQVLVNAIYVSADDDRLHELANLPNVKYVERLRPIKRHLDKALGLMNVPAAWSVLGGENNAGAGVKIAVLDTGIDHRHPAFQDASLPVPAGFPKCQPADCSYTNQKIIAARSYVEMLAFYFGDNPLDTRPDDYSPRDRVGHGTAMAMVAAGVRNSGPVATITGVAPKAFLGNYKIYGSPGVNDTTFDDVIVRALEDALADGMDIATLSSGHPAEWGAADRGVCSSRDPGKICDVRADAIENASRNNMLVVVSAGNDGDRSYRIPAYTSIHTPGTAASALTVGASYNSHIYYQTIRAGDRQFNSLFGDGPKPAGGALTAPLRDVTATGDDGLACSPLPNNSLTGAVALIRRGECLRDLKVVYAQRAGAVGVILYEGESNKVMRPTGLKETGIPTAGVGNQDGLALKDLAGQQATVTLDATPRAVDTQEFDIVSIFSSVGPTIRDAVIKPEVVATATDLYVATQKYDPNGDMYDPSGYTIAHGTSFAGPIAAGVAALVKGRHPSWNAAQIKSAVVNTAVEVDEYDEDGNIVTASVTSAGAGKIDAAAAVRTNVTLAPTTLSFGIIGANLPSRGLTLRNGGSNAVSLRLEVRPSVQDSNARVTLSSNSVNLAPGASTQISVRMEGSRPRPGLYEGFVLITGPGTELVVPYLYQVGDGVPFNILPMYGEGFIALPGGRAYLLFKVLDRYGVPVPDVPVRFRATLGGGSIDLAAEKADALGIAFANVLAGGQIGDQEFIAEVANDTSMTVEFFGRTRPRPAIQTNGVVNAASLRQGQAVAPGSYVTIYGRDLSEATQAASTPYLPLSLSGVSVSFDSGRLSLPARIHFVSPNQINVQVPWELQGANSAIIKVAIGDHQSDVYTVPLLDYAPAAFEFTDASGRLIAAALNESNAVITTANPVARGTVIQLYANGLGPVENPPASGELTPAERLSPVRVNPSVTVGGRPAEVLFAGLAPFNVGLYQINLRIPSDAPTGIQPVEITVNGIVSKAANLPIQ